MWRTYSLEKTVILGKTEDRRRGRQRMRWLDGITNSMDMSLSWWWTGKPGVLQSMGSQSWTHWVTDWMIWNEVELKFLCSMLAFCIHIHPPSTHTQTHWRRVLFSVEKSIYMKKIKRKTLKLRQTHTHTHRYTHIQKDEHEGEPENIYNPWDCLPPWPSWEIPSFA